MSNPKFLTGLFYVCEKIDRILRGLKSRPLHEMGWIGGCQIPTGLGAHRSRRNQFTMAFVPTRVTLVRVVFIVIIHVTHLVAALFDQAIEYCFKSIPSFCGLQAIFAHGDKNRGVLVGRAGGGLPGAGWRWRGRCESERAHGEDRDDPDYS